MIAARDMPEEPVDSLSERAALFWEQRRFGSWNAADQTTLDAWLAESLLHRVAYLRVEAIAARTDALAAVHDFRAPDRATPDSRRNVPARRWIVSLLATASLGLIGLLAVPYVASWLAPPTRSLSTDIGGRNIARFADGTELELNTDSAIRYQMTDHERTVWLDKGEVWFHVAHNSKTPFSVIIGNHHITDTGTEFDVRRGASQVEVALVSGSATLGSNETNTIGLRPGDDAVATSVSVTITRETPQALADKLAWRNGMVMFRNTRLADAVRELNRYNTIKLVIADPIVADERITTDLRPDDLEKFVILTQGVLNLRADRRGNEILFSRAACHAGRTRAHNEKITRARDC